MCLGVGLATAAPVGAVQAAPADPVAEATQLFQDGQAKYETLDYEGAIDTWMKAYVKFPDTDEFRATRGTVLYAIAQARLDLYGTDKDKQHLVLAQRILSSYLSKLDPADTDTRASVQEWLDKVEAKLAEADKAAAPAPVAGPVEPEEPQPLPAEEPAQPADPGPADAPASGRPGKGLIIGGAVMTAVGVGVAAGAGTALGLAAKGRSDDVDAVMNGGNPNDLTAEQTQTLEDEGFALQTGQIISIAAGGALAIGGIVMLAVGAKRNKSGSARASVTPAFGPRFSGLVLQGRF